ncbi:2-polyprenyl-6-methoxyphenol hydroxylase-like FAD-dependent oxidoreductase [Luteibacter sp. Sphag1AF]|uniref:FAD-dependent monooxygenase n=1 Tax=Luteibacter sp. Sphag1AF TaxID=2587031 RepID=UPI00161C5C6A|nr:FAD-dependent monooxygenase [Luteibacter sp. Sphag1AF]MBB3228240.1 2-polyprenyl-6-methoxyphenol hydroxylase-like FAD-dependent oxidoreductase [Luteibacter sp. Sphag1AF]
MIRNVLISGAGVAGLALAYWLDKAGMSVTVVELAPEFRRGGQAIDVRGVALDVIRSMGLYDQVYALRTRLKGMSTLDANGVELERTEERTHSAGRLDSDDIEIFRDDLCELLIGALSERVEIHYGQSISALREEGDEVRVTFASGEEQSFDLVAGADGVYSRTRKLWFDHEAEVIRSLGVVLAIFTTPNFIGLKDWQLIHREEGLGYVIYPNLDQTELRISVGFAPGDAPMARGDVQAQKEMIAARCAGLGGHFPEFIKALQNGSQLYYNELAQIRAPTWSRGRVVLAGDAAHCASPFSGQGTSLALVGALVLARALVHNSDQLPDAMAEYEQRMRPFVLMNQDMVDMTRRTHIPDEVLTRSKNGIDIRDLLAEVA